MPRNTNVEAQFSEPMDAATIDETSVRLRPQGGGSDIAADVTYSGATATLDPDAGLAPNTTYEVTVDGDVEDSNGNSLGADDTWLFTTAGAASASLTDTTVADFSAGSTGPDTYVSESANGEVTLKPTVGAEFSGTALPADWSSCTWPGGATPVCTPGGATVSSQSLHVDGGLAGPSAAFGSGHALEFVATFGAATLPARRVLGQFQQHLRDLQHQREYHPTPSSNHLGRQCERRSPGPVHRHLAPLPDRVGPGPGQVLHRRGAGHVTHDGNFTGSTLGGGDQMRVLASDFNGGGPELTVDWLRMSPYPASGTFNSRIFDAGSSVDWDGLSWSEDEPVGTDVDLFVRTGDTPTPDGSWTAFTEILTSGGPIDSSSRYLQYRADLATADVDLTPVLSEVTVAYAEPFPAPATPTITATDPASPSGDNNPEVKGTVGSGDPTQVKIWRNATCTGAPDATGTVAQFIGTGITVNVPGDATTTLSAKASNAGGDSACSNAFSYVEDSTAPAAPSVDASTPPSPANDNDPELAGSAEAGSTIRIYKAATAADCTPANLAATGSQAAFAGAGLTVSVLDDTTTNFRATATDATGNTSECSAPFEYTEDSSPPAAPSIDASTPSSPANENAPELAGLGAAGSTVRLYQSADCTGPVEAQGSAAEFASPGLTATVDDDSDNAFSATATDAAGNTSPCSAAFTYTEDSTAPETTIDTGPSGETSDSTPSFTFSSSEPGSSFQCRFDAAAFGACSGPGAAHTAAAALTEGAHSFEVRATDQAANTDQTPASRSFTVDSLAPDAPTIETSTPASPANDNDPELVGSAEAGSTIRIYKAATAADCTPANLAATGTEAAFAGAGLTVSVADDTTTTSGRRPPTPATPPMLGPVHYTEDSTAPETTIDSGPAGETSDSTPTFTFSSSEPGSSFQCRFDAAPSAPARAPATPTPPPALTEGAHSFEVRATDQAANTDQTPASRSFTVDSLAPDAPSIDASTPASPANDNDPELVGSAEAGSSDSHLQGRERRRLHPPQRRRHRQPADFAAAGLTVTVDDDTTTSLPRNRHRRRQHLRLLGPVHLHRGLDRPRDDDRHRPLGRDQRLDPVLHLLLLGARLELPMPL